MAKEKKKIRGVFEKVQGSGEWWIQYFDAEGRRRREKAGAKSHAIQLYQKRKTEVRQGKKLPENLPGPASDVTGDCRRGLGIFANRKGELPA